MDLYPGKYPAIVREYLAESRTCRVEIPGITDGAEVLPIAEIEYPIGDKSKGGALATEIEILPGDTVWVEFIAGDPRYPLMTGWRNPGAGNSVDWRRWHHRNIEMLADELFKIIAGSDVLVKSGTKATTEAPVIFHKTGGSLNGVVQGDCICAFTGAPHGQISATVIASK